MANGKPLTVSARFHEPYRTSLEELAEQTGIKKSHLLKLFTISALDSDFLGIKDRLTAIEKEVRSFRKDFNDAVEK